jgi:hypothetical protein
MIGTGSPPPASFSNGSCGVTQSLTFLINERSQRPVSRCAASVRTRAYYLAKSKRSSASRTERPVWDTHKIAHYVLDSRDSFNNAPDFVFRNRLRQQSRQRYLSLLRGPSLRELGATQPSAGNPSGALRGQSCFPRRPNSSVPYLESKRIARDRTYSSGTGI